MFIALDHKVYFDHIYMLMSFPNYWHAKSIFYGKGFHSNWQTFNVGSACYCLLISLYIKLIYLCTKKNSGERMIILHAGYNEGFVPNARKKSFYFPISK